ncbi:cupin domain-containing protein [Asaia siamensis]|uniref:Cupin type-2 domain-containing protein n=1 Tax=Asaia siamensis TaxID=110479 RepID=A0ABQ1MN65_9PROT|nr:cupin domain-containing protein [Asaia siamensis]GBR03958.1 hypothetical protein AA0323_0510 [Asaia siamensis NRIC 0323]GGC41781.1 hypothetical protein GCM10007207_28840 [Asaia siamensis]
MRFSHSLALGTLALGLGAGLTGQAHAQQTATAHADHLLKADHSWNGKAYTHYPSGQPTLMMIKLTIPPHTALPWHTHPIPNVGYVLEGQLTIEDKVSGASHTFHQGEAFAESMDDAHRGVSGDTATVLLLTYAGGNNLPTSIPLKGEKKEY